jgi:DNA-binding NarL/FixJ family response regulator
MREPIRIAVVDDHPLFRDGVVAALSSAGMFEVVAQGSTAADALAIAAKFKPQIMLVDLGMPGGGIAAAKAIATNHPDVKVIMLTVSEVEEHVSAALESGARGYILKGIGGAELVATIRAIQEGDSYVSPALAARVLMQMRRRPAAATPAEDSVALTAREEQILALVSAGMTNKEIAIELDISEKTVKHYMTNIMQKLQVRNRVEAVMSLRKRLPG